ncbi:TniQ family protein [Methylomonas sp. YC3]
MLIPFSDYPVRPQLQPGESLMGYVYRFYSANGHSLPLDVRQLLSRWYTYEQDESFQMAQSLFGGFLSLKNYWWIRYAQNPLVNALERNRTLTGILRIPTPLWFCPKCLSEDEFYYGLWECKLIEVCPFHRIELARSCPKCRRNFSWRWLSADWKCVCGLELVTLITKPARQYELDLAHQVAFVMFRELPVKLQRNLKPNTVSYEFGRHKLKQIRDLTKVAQGR